MTRWTWFLAVLLMLTCVSPAHAKKQRKAPTTRSAQPTQTTPSTPAVLEKPKAKFESTIDSYENEVVDKIEKLTDGYLQGLDVLKKEYQEKGMLNSYMVIKDEQERFTARKSIQSSEIAQGFSRLAKMQQLFIDRQQQIVQEHRLKQARMARAYLSYLEKLKRALTRKAELESALVVATEEKAVRSRFDLSVLDVKPQPEKSPQRGTSTGRATTPAVPGAPNAPSQPAGEDPFIELKIDESKRITTTASYYSYDKKKSIVSVEVALKNRNPGVGYQGITGTLNVLTRRASGKDTVKIIIRDERTFDLDRGDEHSYETKRVVLDYYSGGGYSSGHEYYGYIFFLKDGTGRVLKSDFSHPQLKKYAEKIISQRTDSEFRLSSD